MSDPTYKNVLIRVPPETHLAARIKSIRLGKSFNKVLNEKLVEWLKEPDHKDESPKNGKRASK